MDTRFLDSFIVAAECGSMAEAARRMNITPTAMAQRVKALEQELGISLLLRAGRYVRLTEGGARLLENARAVQRHVRDFKASVLTDGFPEGLRLGSVRTALGTLMPNLLGYLAQHHPKLDAKIEIGASHDLYHLLGTNKIDAALVVDPPFNLPKSMTWQTLRIEPLVMLVPASIAREDHIELLRTQPFIRYDRRTWGGDLAERYLRERKIRPHERFEIDSPDRILALVARELGVSIVPNCFSADTLPQNIVLVPLAHDRLQRRLGMLWSTDSVYGPLFANMCRASQALSDA